MGSILLKWYYTSLVEHYFRMAVRYTKVSNDTPADWFVFTQYWIDRQSKEDREFIQAVFARPYRHAIDGLYALDCSEPIGARRERLARLERQFAIDGGLCGEELELQENDI